MLAANQPITELLAGLRSATDAEKCHRCGCFRGTVEQLHSVVAIITTPSVAGSAIVIVRRARASTCPTCQVTPSGDPVDDGQVESLTN